LQRIWWSNPPGFGENRLADLMPRTANNIFTRPRASSAMSSIGAVRREVATWTLTQES
jgi:hypothetical protein